MQTALKIEMLKAKGSTYLKTALVLPCIFLVFTLMTILSSTNPTGMADGVSIIQSNIFNLWGLILLPICIVVIISSDFQQEYRALGRQRALANNWSLKWIYLAKTLKFWLLVLFSQLILIVIVLNSNLLTTKIVGDFPLLFCTSLVIWIGSLPLIVINMYLLSYLNAIMVSILNLFISIGSTFLGITLAPWFWIDPWVYALRTTTLLRSNPNGTILTTGNTLVNDTSFIYLILLSVTFWVIINYLYAIIIDRKVA